MATRLLDLTLGNPFRNVAMEQALFEVSESPLLRVWENQKSVVVGRAQLVEAETDVGYCEIHGIPIVRRFTAGGTVYNGPGNTNWTFVAKKDAEGGGPRYSPDANAVFKEVALLVIGALAGCGVAAVFDPPNRILDREGRKVSGMAAYVSNRATICHGTLLRSADLSEAEKVSSVREGVVPGRYPRSRSAAMANCGIGRDEFVLALAQQIGATKGTGAVTTKEEARCEDFFVSRYSDPGWNLGDPFALDYL